MRLIETLQASIAGDDSPFRAQLMREDITRINELREAASELSSTDALRNVAIKLSWTATEARTNELAAHVHALSDAIFDHVSAAEQATDQQESAVEQCWLQLHHQRLETMIGCLSTPLPKPVD
jgi:hypothetical protein